ncbi:hypothetical protein JW930_01165 [Candidatus Woesearchaeota archaeon]|nr:hypothetical protein [Candidatus Woesearchaeota archaeon]
MKKVSLPIIMFILVASFAAAGDLVYNNWVVNHNSVTIGGENYKIDVATGGSTILVTSGANTIVIGKRESGLFPLNEIYFNSSVYDLDIADYKVYVKIYTIKPKFSIQRAISATTLSVGDKATFSVEITNTGDTEATEVKYIEDFPSSFAIEKCSSCDIADNQVLWEGDIESQDSVSFSYEVYCTEKVDTTLRAYVEYLGSKYYSSSVSFTVEPLLESSILADKSEIEMMEETRVNFSITNLIEDDIDIKRLEITVPKSLVVENHNLEEEEGLYVWDGSLTNGTKKFYIDVSGKLSGTSLLIMTVDYDYDTMSLTKTITKEINVVNKGIEITSSLENEQSFEEGKSIRITFGVKNLNSFIDIKNVKPHFSSTLLNITGLSYPRLAVNQSDRLVDMMFALPDVTSSTTHDIDLNITYESQHGEEFSQKTTKKITIVPIRGISITKTLSADSIEEEGIVTVTVQLTNDRVEDTIYNIKVSEDIPNFKIEGVTSNTLSLAPGQSLEAYSYQITAPRIIAETAYELRTDVYYKDLEGEYNPYTIKTLTVTPRSSDVSVTKSAGSMHLGKTSEVNYVIENRDTEPVYDIVLFFTEDQEFDTVDSFSTSIDKMDPGESLRVTEKVRPKTYGTIGLDSSIFRYANYLGRELNSTAAAISISVTQVVLEGPVVLLTKLVDKNTLGEEDVANVTLTIRNIGDTEAIIQLYDIQEWNLTIGPETEQNITYNLTKDNIFTDKAVAYYSYKDSTYRAVSDPLSISAVSTSAGSSGSQGDSSLPGTGTTTTTTDEEIVNIYEKSLLKKIVDWFIGLFSKKK